ncbi:hypothetical protein ACOMHN_036057 [Nucella lapillus]
MAALSLSVLPEGQGTIHEPWARSEQGRKLTIAEKSRSYRERLKQNPQKYLEYKKRDALRKRRKKLLESGVAVEDLVQFQTQYLSGGV